MNQRSWFLTIFGVVVLGLLCPALAWAQANAVDLTGTITDPQNAAVTGAKVKVRNLATNAAREVLSGEDGRYTFVNLPPGRYELSIEKAGFAKVVNPEVTLTVGQAARLDTQLQLSTGMQTVTVTEATQLVETQRTEVSETVDSRQINNLPINGRNYVNFTLINSQANRDSAPSIGAAPTSGLNFGGQRARSNEVSVDGADAVDNSVNGIRSTVSQEDVQEFQLILGNFMPEYGRATGGVINIVTKSGSNEFHGDAFGFLRNGAIQARNPFSFKVNPATGVPTPVKQSYTRAQYGVAFGGPIRKDKTFYFFSFEGTRREETGFTDIGMNNFDGALTSGPLAGLTPTQANFIATNPLGLPAGVLNTYAALAGSGASVARIGIDPGLICGLLCGGLPGARFPIPVPCAIGSTTPITCFPTLMGGLGLAGLPASYVALTRLIGNYPITEKTDLYALRLDQIWNTNNSSFVRANVSPSLVTGIQVNAQNQNFGQNAGSRTSNQHYRDIDIVGQHTTTFSSNLLNEFRFQFARRGLHYGFSDCSVGLCPTSGGLADGGQVAVNITGFAFFGREPFSTVDRIERRYQWTDNVTLIQGKHTIKFGEDTNFIQLRSKKTQIFELNFGGIYNFGSLDANPIVSALLGAPITGLPQLTAIQAYGLGLPQNFIQGVGNSNSPFDNRTFGGYIQDSWRIAPKVTLNFGLRYDIEFTPTFAPANPTNVAAEKALGVVEGIPVFHNGVQPRFGIAWDPWGDGKTVIRAGGGIFYDHPLLAVAFDSTTADGARSSQLIAAGGSPSACGVFPSAVFPVCGGTADSPANLNAGSLFQGVLNPAAPAALAPLTIPYIASQQRFNAKSPTSVFINENYITAGFATPILPFTLPVSKDFQYGYATQANLSIERNLGHDFKVSASFLYSKGTHLYRPRNVNTSNPLLLDNNLRNAAAAGIPGSNPVLVQAPNGNILPTGTTCGVSVGAPLVPSVLGVLFGCPGALAPLNGQFVGTAAVFNFFAPSGPNPSFAGPNAVAYPGLVGLAAAASYPTGYFSGSTPIIVPFSQVLQQESSGNSTYNGLTINLEKRFSSHYQFLASYTYSHAIDDSTDLQTLLAPQDNNKPNLERGNSTFDQRHRFVFSAVMESPYKMSEGGWKAVLGDWVFAPIIEASTGRPYTVLTGTDYNLDFGSNTDRPSVVPGGTPGAVQSPFIHGVNFFLPTVCPVPALLPFGCTGNLGRNTFYRPNYFSVDMRLSRKFKVTERFSFEVLADMFNLLNRYNVADVNPLCDPGAPPCTAGQPTSSFDPRTFQFGLKLYF
jgi:hypothetical protein